MGGDEPAGGDNDHDQHEAGGGRDTDGDGGVPSAAAMGSAEGPRRPAAALDEAHAHIGRRCPTDRSTAPVPALPPSPQLPPPPRSPSLCSRDGWIPAT